MKLKIDSTVDYKTAIPVHPKFATYANVLMVIPGATTCCNGSSSCSCCGGVEL